jgi:hypothetical protein
VFETELFSFFNSRTEGHDSAAISDVAILEVLTKMVK